MSHRTPRDQFLSHLKRVMKSGETASERLAATKMYRELTFGLDEKGAPTPVPNAPDGAISLPELPAAPIVTKPLGEFAETAQSVQNNCTVLMHSIRALRDEALAFWVWRRDAGEAQAGYIADLTRQHQLQVADLNVAILEHSFDLQQFWDWIFEPKSGGRYPFEILQQARQALGV
jgi:hypothetical protein